MPKLQVPSSQNSEQFTQQSIQGTAAAVASGAAVGDTQRTAGAAATAQGAGIGEVMMQAAKQSEAFNQRYFDEAQQSIDASIYNTAIQKARDEFNTETQKRLSQPYDQNGNPTFATLDADINKIGDAIKQKYGSTIGNPNVLNRFNNDFNTFQTNSSMIAQQTQREQLQQYTVGSMYKNVNSAANSAVTWGAQGDTITRDMYYTQAQDALNEALQNGSISPLEFEKRKEALRSDVYYNTLETLNTTDPRALQQMLQTNTPEDLKINQMEFNQIVHKNIQAVNALQAAEAKVTREQEQIQLKQQTFNAENLNVGITKGEANSQTIQQAYDRGDISHKMWQDLTNKALQAEGVSAKKSATITAISGDVNSGGSLSKYTSENLNDYYDHSVGLLSGNGQKPVSMMDKAAIAASTKAPISHFTDEVKSIVKGETDANKVIEAVKAADYAAQANPYSIQSMDQETMGLVSMIATGIKATNQDPARVVDNARKAIINIDPTVKEFRDTHFSRQDKFKPANIEDTINKTIQSQTSGFATNSKIQTDLIPMYNSMFKQAYAITGDEDAAVDMVKRWTAHTVGATAVNNTPGWIKDTKTAMLFPPEKVFPQYKPEEIRANLNQSLAGILSDNSHNPAGLVPDQVFIGSDATTRQDLTNPSYLLYYVDKQGNQQILLDKQGLPVHYKLDATERAKIDQSREDALRIQHEAGVQGNAQQKDFMNQKTTGNTLDKIFRQSHSSNSVLSLAQKYVGLGEIKDNRILGQTMSKMLGQAVDPARTPWCAAFVNTMLQANGIKGSGSLGATSFLQWGKPTTTPQEGDVVVARSTIPGRTGHVGFFAGYEYQNGQRMVKILGGNVDNKVGYSLKAERDIMGYRQPPTVSELQTDPTMQQIMGHTTNRSISMASSEQEMATMILKKFEGFSSGTYWDVNAHRLGYGTDTITTADNKVIPVRQGMKVSKADAERDLARRVGEFEQRAAGQTGGAWSPLPPQAKAALISVAYNYGSLPKNVVAAVQTGDIGTIANSVQALASHNKGVNARRRMQEAQMIRSSANMRMSQNTVPNIHANNPKVPIRDLSSKEISVIMKENSTTKPAIKGDKA